MSERAGTDSLVGSLNGLATLPGVGEAVAQAREACTQLRWHQALRRRIPEAAAESRVRGARASALLEGADVAVDEVRQLMIGALPWPTPLEPVLATLRSAVQATAEAEQAQRHVNSAPLQALARLHVAAGTPLLPDDQVGRPRHAGEDARELIEVGPALPAEQLPERLAGVSRMVALGEAVPGVVVAALVHAEIALIRPFVRGNTVVARAFERALLKHSGVDPTGVAVPEVGHHASGAAGYVGALSAYATGSADGVALWLRHCAEALTRGAAEGTSIADAVLAGRLNR